MIIKHGLVVDPASGLSEHMDILVKNGKIARIAPEISEDSEEILEAGGGWRLFRFSWFRGPGRNHQTPIRGVSACHAVGGSGDGRRRRNLRHVHS